MYLFTLLVLRTEKYTISFIIFVSHCFFIEENVTGKIAQRPAIAHNFWATKLFAITRFYCNFEFHKINHYVEVNYHAEFYEIHTSLKGEKDARR